jgi:MYXO-CTERM domain-containing protein
MSGGGGTSGGSTDAGSGTDNGGSNHGHHHHHGSYFPHFACSATGGDASSQSASWFGLVGLIAFGLRRRARGARA